MIDSAMGKIQGRRSKSSLVYAIKIEGRMADFYTDAHNCISVLRLADPYFFSRGDRQLLTKAPLKIQGSTEKSLIKFNCRTHKIYLFFSIIFPFMRKNILFLLPFFRIYGRIKENENKEVNLDKIKSILLKIWNILKTVFKVVSIILNMLFFSFYLIYLFFAIIFGLGNLWVNIVLAAINLGFMIFYLVLRLSKKMTKRMVKHLKQYYNIFMTVARISTLLTAILALFAAIETVHPILIFLALAGVVFLLLHLLFSIIFNLIGRTLEKIIDGIKKQVIKLYNKFFKKKKADEGDNEESYENTSKVNSDKNKSHRDEANDIIIPLEDCLISDAEDTK